jgi:branched-chain amino acid transport system substrate-binding protein
MKSRLSCDSYVKKAFLVLIVVSVALVGVFLTGCGSSNGGSADEDALVIGITVGRASIYGQNSEESAKLAAEEINAAGGVDIGGKKVPIKLEIVDTRDEEPGVPTSDVLLTVEKLLLEKQVDAVTGGPSMSECSMALLDLYAKYKVPNVVATGTWTPAWNKKVGEDPEKYMYSFRMSGHVGYWVKDAAALLDQIKEQYGFDKLYVSSSDAAHTQAAAGAIKDLAAENGWTVVGEETHPMGSSDYSALMRDVASSGAQVLFWWDCKPEVAIGIKQWYDMKVPAILMGFLNPLDEPTAWDDLDGKIVSTIQFNGEGGCLPGSEFTPLTSSFFDAFVAKFDKEPRGCGNVPTYTAMYVLKEAFEKAGTRDKEAVAKAIAEIEMVTAGGYLKFGDDHQAVYGTDPDATLVGQWLQWQDGKRVCIYPEAAATGEIQLPPWMQ